MLLSRSGIPLAYSYLPGPSDNLSNILLPGSQFGYGVLAGRSNRILATAPAFGSIFVFDYIAAFKYTNSPLDLSVLYNIVLPVIGSVLGCCGLIAWFLWYFRRKPDAVEPLVLKTNIEIGKIRKRKKRKERKVHEGVKEAERVYVEHYEL